MAAESDRSRGPCGVRALAFLGVLIASSSCAPRAGLVLPAGTGQPSERAEASFATAAASCRDVASLSAEIAVSGRLAGQRIRGRLLLGVERGGRLRVEALAPFGEPVFVLVADGGQATLLLPRERRVLEGADAAEVLDALSGVAVAGDDLLALLAGCVASGAVSQGAAVGPMAVVRVGARARAWVGEQAGRARVVMGELATGQAPLLVGYAGFAADDRPREVRLERHGPAGEVALLLRLSQLDYDRPLSGDAFLIRMPPGVRPVTLDELRRTSPLAAR